MVALPSDVARGDRLVKQAFEGVFKAMVHFLEQDVRKSTHDAAATAQAIAALCIGGMVVARAMDDRKHADELRDACKAVALKLGGGRRDQRRQAGVVDGSLGPPLSVEIPR
jgi:hypothetical protein